MIRVNNQIKSRKVRLIDQEGDNKGVVALLQAQDLARTAGLDLVEVSPQAKPPVCKIMDYGKYRYDLSKREKKSRLKNKTKELKQVRLGRNLRIEEHDIKIRVKQAREFLEKGHKVQFVQRIAGREVLNKQVGIDRLKDIADRLSDISSVDSQPRFADRKIIMTLSPAQKEPTK